MQTTSNNSGHLSDFVLVPPVSKFAEKFHSSSPKKISVCFPAWARSARVTRAVSVVVWAFDLGSLIQPWIDPEKELQVDAPGATKHQQ